MTEQRERQINKKRSAARELQRNTKDQKTKDELGKNAHRNSK